MAKEIKYFASADRLALYRIEDGIDGYYFDKGKKEWVRKDDVCRVMYDTTSYDEISKEEADSLEEEFSV